MIDVILEMIGLNFSGHASFVGHSVFRCECFMRELAPKYESSVRISTVRAVLTGQKLKRPSSSRGYFL